MVNNQAAAVGRQAGSRFAVPTRELEYGKLVDPNGNNVESTQLENAYMYL